MSEEKKPKEINDATSEEIGIDIAEHHERVMNAYATIEQSNALINLFRNELTKRKQPEEATGE